MVRDVHYALYWLQIQNYSLKIVPINVIYTHIHDILTDREVEIEKQHHISHNERRVLHEVVVVFEVNVCDVRHGRDVRVDTRRVKLV